MGGHDDDGPLRPTYRVERPPWIGLWSNREYKGQPEYWAEPGLKDRVLRNGRYRSYRDAIQEWSKDHYDAPVPDGTSLSGPNGVDSTRTHNFAIKGDTPGDLREWQKKIMEGSLQYKQILEKYNLSPEHPGIAVSPTMTDLRKPATELLGINTLMTNKWQHWGPKFFNKPLNEGTFEKVLCAAKYTAIAMLPYTMFDIRATHCITVREFTPRRFFGHYFKLTPFPMAIATSWAFSISAAAAIREKDDVKNHFIAGPTVGLVVATIKDNFYMGTMAAIVATVLGLFWQYQRVSEFGLQGKSVPQMITGFHGGPLGWQLLQQGDVEVPERRY